MLTREDAAHKSVHGQLVDAWVLLFYSTYHSGKYSFEALLVDKCSSLFHQLTNKS